VTDTQYGIDFGAGTDSGKPVRASIWNEDTDAKVLDCLFNPTEYTFARTNNWANEPSMQADVPLPTFRGSQAMTLSVRNLLFDTYARVGRAETPEDVRTYTEKLFKLMNVDPSTADTEKKTPPRPPRVSFRCGTFFSFKSVVTSMTQRFTLFWDDGRPIRAKVDVTFQQVESEGSYPPQNPTSLGLARKLRIVGPDDTIDAIAYAEYGDPSKWRLIADHNRLDNPMRLRPGQRLAIPRAT
jgi:nucleoid-associated protein YgaU